MNISNHNADDTVLQELGHRLSRYRLNRNLTQAQLAREAGVSERTLIRMEQGKPSQTTSLVRVLRVLKLIDNLDALVPVPQDSPMQRLKLQGKQRQRASGNADNPEQQPWTWGE